MIISKKHGSYAALFSTLLCILLLSACDPADQAEIAPAKVQKKAHRIEVVTVKDQAIMLKQTLSGTLEAVTRIRLYNEESGRITLLPYHEGDVVKKGTLLVQLDNALLKTDVAKSTASKQQAELDLSRLRKLLPKQISTEEEVARARTEVDLATAEAERQQTRFRRTSIRAPIDGLITERLFEPGDMLAPQSHILTIIDPSQLRLKVDLAERWLPLVKKGQPVSLRIDALGDKKFSAVIDRVHPTINTSTHKGKIEILLTPVPRGAVAGQLSRADIELAVSSLLTVPVRSIHYDAEGAYVYRVDEDSDGRAIVRKTFFEQGQQYASVAEVLSGLNKGDRIVSRGFLGLRDAKKVEIAASDEVNSNRPASVRADGDKP